MDSGNARQTRIVRIQRRRNRRKPRHQPVDVKFAWLLRVISIATVQQSFDLVPPANNETTVSSLNQRRRTEDQTVLATAKTEIVLSALA